MSVAALAAEIRRAVAAFPVPLLEQVGSMLGDAHAGFAEAARGTSATELPDIVRGLGEAQESIDRARHSIAEVSRLFEGYLAQLGAAGASDNAAAPSSTTQTPRASDSAVARPRLSDAARELVNEVQRRGDKISPDQVVRIEKPSRIVWLEEGNERAGLAHLLIDKRVADFARHGIGRDEIVDAVFTALTDGTPIGITGRDRVVYLVTYQGHSVRIAISVGDNGFIVGANPVSLDRKVNPLP